MPLLLNTLHACALEVLTHKHHIPVPPARRQSRPAAAPGGVPLGQAQLRRAPCRTSPGWPCCSAQQYTHQGHKQRALQLSLRVGIRLSCSMLTICTLQLLCCHGCRQNCGRSLAEHGGAPTKPNPVLPKHWPTALFMPANTPQLTRPAAPVCLTAALLLRRLPCPHSCP
jgi:hypothetical protein